ncbi:Glutathione S-transferase domain protein [hydrothermal vent metagenome]|uniref:Glutathione S-transferase domain protein n=1 Tax=hydrothermal vent metagenome TaxID=652676 RepID=A0A3B0ZVK4_9ZZZZ
MINAPILYSFRRCPYAMRARMALVYSDVQVELREVDLKNKPQELVLLSPKATVPVLLKSDNSLLDESMDIIFWALSVRDNDDWLKLTVEQQKIAALLIQQNDTNFKTWLDKYKYSQRFPEQTESFYRKQGEQFLNELNERLSEFLFLIKDSLSYVDIAVAPFIRQFANVDLSWFQQSQYQHLVKWLDIILNSKLFKTTMQKYPVWQSGNKKILFPPS